MNGSNALLNGLYDSVGALAAYQLWQKYNSSTYPLPPSSTSYPLLGNLLSMPTKDEHVGFMEIEKQLNSKPQSKMRIVSVE
jgi:hypothetical protein